MSSGSMSTKSAVGADEAGAVRARDERQRRREHEIARADARPRRARRAARRSRWRRPRRDGRPCTRRRARFERRRPAGPVVSQSLRSVATTAAMSSSSIDWRPYGITSLEFGPQPADLRDVTFDHGERSRGRTGASLLRHRRGRLEPQPRPRHRAQADRRRGRRRRRRGEVPDLLGPTLYSTKTPRFDYLDDELADKPAHELLDEISLPRDWQPILAEHCRDAGHRVHELAVRPPSRRRARRARTSARSRSRRSSWSTCRSFVTPPPAGEPLILSTGMASLGEIDEAVTAAREAGTDQIALLAVRVAVSRAART